MNIIFFLIPISLLLLAIIIGLFFWASRNRQFDDLESPAHRILFDDKLQKIQQIQQKETQEKTHDRNP
jgi:cbb3-type cytochrome oxidase maturation protein